MKNKLAKLGVAVSTFALALPAFADGFGTSTIQGVILSLIVDFGLVVGAVLTSILGLWIAFKGLGWAISKLSKYGTGKHKF